MYVPPGAYKVVANDGMFHHYALRIQKPLRLVMDPLAELRLQSNNYKEYAVIDIGAGTTPQDRLADVEVRGGRIYGDLTTHTWVDEEDAGESGFGIRVWAENVTIRDVYIADCWGDGIFVGARSGGGTGYSKHVSILNCTCDNNRRNGMSIVDVERCRVIGGAYINTGQWANSQPKPVKLPLGPYAGIRPEPDNGSHVLALTITAVTCHTNVGSAITEPPPASKSDATKPWLRDAHRMKTVIADS